MTTSANRSDATPEQRLLQLGITLPPPWADKPNRVRALRSGIHVFMSGHGPLDPATDAPLVGFFAAAVRDAARVEATLALLRDDPSVEGAWQTPDDQLPE